jgi:hypothetical protein
LQPVLLTLYLQYEALKKKNAKKAGGAAKKKDDKPEASTVTETQEEKAEDTVPAPEAAEAPETTSESPGPVHVEDDEPTELPSTTPSHNRKPSIAVESRQRSASFYRAAGGPTSPTGTTPGGGVSSDIYREQAQRIEELEKENKRLATEVEQGETRWKKGEEELEELREGRGEAALAAEKAKEVDKLVRSLCYVPCEQCRTRTGTDIAHRSLRSNRSSDSCPISSLNLQSPASEYRLLHSPPLLMTSMLKLRLNPRQLNRWSWRSRISTNKLRTKRTSRASCRQEYPRWRARCRKQSKKPVPPKLSSWTSRPIWRRRASRLPRKALIATRPRRVALS